MFIQQLVWLGRRWLLYTPSPIKHRYEVGGSLKLSFSPCLAEEVRLGHLYLICKFSEPETRRLRSLGPRFIL